MEYLHQSSMPASKSELSIFSIPPTQVAIDTHYEVDYRPAASLENGKTYELNIPSSEDFTDLSATMVHINLNILDDKGQIVNTENSVKLVSNFGNALFEQIDLILGTTNTSLANNMYHYQAYLENLLYRHPCEAEKGVHDIETAVVPNKTYELYFRLNVPMCTQDKLLLSGVPIIFKFTRSTTHFPLISNTNTNYTIKINKFSLILRRVKLYPDAQVSILKTLEAFPAKYFITRSDTKGLTISKGVTNVTVENIFIGQLPKRIIIGFLDDKCLSGDIQKDPWKFEHFNINHICLNIDGVLYPSIPYTPNFEQTNAVREFVDLYRVLGQDDGVPQMKLSYEKYLKDTVLFAFDIGGDLGAETGVLSLIKRGKVRLEIRFNKTLDKTIKAIIFGQYDNLITIDKDRQITIDY